MRGQTIHTDTTVIRDQVRLPLAMAFGVVWQGFRIRLGRSLVTLTGVVLGVAFLMSTLVSHTIRQGLSHENEVRDELTRMLSVLTADAGPVAGAVIGVIAVGDLNDAETRLVRALLRGGAARLTWAGKPPPAGAFGDRLRPASLAAAGRGAAAVLLVGDGPAPACDWNAVLREAAQPLLAVTRATHAPAAAGGANVIRLQREWLPGERRDRELLARRQRFRTIWITAIALMVTVIGIANAMLMSVTERFREIGALKCLGALSSFIRRIYFIEAALLGLAGSLLGACLGALFAITAYGCAYGPGQVWSALDVAAVLRQGACGLAAGVALAVAAAVYPAGVAARMAPAAALRSTL